MPCKSIARRTCNVRLFHLTVNTTPLSFFWVLFYTRLCKIKIFLGGGKALKVRNSDFQCLIVAISRPWRRERAKSSSRFKGSGFWSLNLSHKEWLFHHRFLEPSTLLYRIKYTNITICGSFLNRFDIFPAFMIVCSFHVI